MKYRRYVDDPVLVRANFRCEYCDTDLLRDLDAFLSIRRDHFTPKSIGGPDGHHNRVASCAVCDFLKGPMVFDDLEAARAEIADQRRTRGVWLDRIRGTVRGISAEDQSLADAMDAGADGDIILEVDE